MKTKLLTFILSSALLAAIIPAALHANELPPEPTVKDAPCSQDTETGIPVSIAALQAQITNSIDGADSDNNCGLMDSCGDGSCHRIRGGSERRFPNRIPNCRSDLDRQCFDVYCGFVTYFTVDCSGEPLAEGSHDVRGCRTRAEYP